MRFYGKYIKSLLEIFFILITAVIWLVPFVIILTLLSFPSSEKAIFKQERLGFRGKKFKIYKFRTMSNDKDENGNLLCDSKRITRLGHVLRKTSLDELPGLMNVLKGDMSIVGPRPERPVLVEKFRNDIPGYMLKHKVPAGITGWAQVNGLRGDTDLNNRISYDLYYIENWSLLFDLKIIILTAIQVFFPKYFKMRSEYE